MILIFAKMTIATLEDAKKLRAAAVEVCKQSRQEAGCLHYTFAQDFDDPLVVRIAERYADEAAIMRHMRTPYFAAFMAAVEEIGIVSMSGEMFDGANQRDAAKLLELLD
jgi:quinol monooxygenase YgiN